RAHEARHLARRHPTAARLLLMSGDVSMTGSERLAILAASRPAAAPRPRTAMGMCRALPPLLLALLVGCSGIITAGGGDDDDDGSGDGDSDGDDGTPVEPDPFEA